MMVTDTAPAYAQGSINVNNTRGIEIVEDGDMSRHKFGTSRGEVMGGGTRIPDRSAVSPGRRCPVVVGHKIYKGNRMESLGTDLQTLASMGVGFLTEDGQELQLEQVMNQKQAAASENVPESGNLEDQVKRILQQMQSEAAQEPEQPVAPVQKQEPELSAAVRVSLITSIGEMRMKCRQVILTEKSCIICYPIEESSFAPSAGSSVTVSWNGVKVEAEATGFDFEAAFLGCGFLVFRVTRLPDDCLTDEELLQNLEQSVAGKPETEIDTEAEA